MLHRPEQDLACFVHGLGWLGCLSFQDAVSSFGLHIVRLSLISLADSRYMVTVLSTHKSYSTDVAKDIVSAILETTARDSDTGSAVYRTAKEQEALLEAAFQKWWGKGVFSEAALPVSSRHYRYA